MYQLFSLAHQKPKYSTPIPSIKEPANHELQKASTDVHQGSHCTIENMPAIFQRDYKMKRDKTSIIIDKILLWELCKLRQECSDDKNHRASPSRVSYSHRMYNTATVALELCNNKLPSYWSRDLRMRQSEILSSPTVVIRVSMTILHWELSRQHNLNKSNWDGPSQPKSCLKMHVDNFHPTHVCSCISTVTAKGLIVFSVCTKVPNHETIEAFQQDTKQWHLRCK